MPISAIQSDPATLTLTAVGDYPVPVDRLWAAWADPRKLERFWGPPTWPATFTRHDMSVPGRSEYFMSGPNGEQAHAMWIFEEVTAPRGFAVQDLFCHEAGKPNHDMPQSRMRLTFEPTATGSRFTAVSTFASAEAMERLVAMGMVEGLSQALAQMDEVLADLREGSRSLATELVVEDDTHAVVTREVRGTIGQVWRAHHEAALIQRWMLGPDGWTMPVCVPATEVGQRYRYEWRNESDGATFGFTGEVTESEAPRREVSTETMIGVPGPGTVNELVLTPRPGGRTLITLRITYPSRELRDQILGTGMVEGMEASYARMEGLLD